MPIIEWRLHLRSSPDRVYEALATDHGRVSFWAERSSSEGKKIDFTFADGTRWSARVREATHPSRFAVDYLGGEAVFELSGDGAGGTELRLRQLADADSADENAAGWVSVLLALKAAVDHGVDLRNHDPKRTWAQGYVDN